MSSRLREDQNSQHQDPACGRAANERHSGASVILVLLLSASGVLAAFLSWLVGGSIALIVLALLLPWIAAAVVISGILIRNKCKAPHKIANNRVTEAGNSAALASVSTLPRNAKTHPPAFVEGQRNQPENRESRNATGQNLNRNIGRHIVACPDPKPASHKVAARSLP